MASSGSNSLNVSGSSGAEPQMNTRNFCVFWIRLNYLIASVVGWDTHHCSAFSKSFHDQIDIKAIMKHARLLVIRVQVR